jgi:hypothetical protein
MGPDEMKHIARWMDEGVEAAKASDEDAIERIFRRGEGAHRIVPRAGARRVSAPS